jgi:transposase
MPEGMKRNALDFRQHANALEHTGPADETAFPGACRRLGRISKMGDKYLRRLLVVGMTSLIRRAKYKPEAVDPWLADLLSRKPARLVTVALVNKAARVVWAITVRGGVYRMPAGVTTPV